MPIKYILWVRQDLNLKMIARFKNHIDNEMNFSHNTWLDNI